MQCPQNPYIEFNQNCTVTGDDRQKQLIIEGDSLTIEGDMQIAHGSKMVLHVIEWNNGRFLFYTHFL